MPNQNHNSQHHPFKKFLLGTPDDDLLNGTDQNDFLFGFRGGDH